MTITIILIYRQWSRVSSWLTLTHSLFLYSIFVFLTVIRDRILNLPLMVAAVLTLLWPDVAGVTELTRMLAREGFLWCKPTKVSQQAISQRFLSFPSGLFEKIFKYLLPNLSRAWHGRKQRPLPIWGTWLFYAVLVDLGDAVADELSLPFDNISLEMIYRSLYHFYVADHKGKASDPVKYFASPENQDLGIVKRQRKPHVKLIVAPFPDKQRGSDQFFFQASSPHPLTTAS